MARNHKSACKYKSDWRAGNANSKTNRKGSIDVYKHNKKYSLFIEYWFKFINLVCNQWRLRSLGIGMFIECFRLVFGWIGIFGRCSKLWLRWFRWVCILRLEFEFWRERFLSDEEYLITCCISGVCCLKVVSIMFNILQLNFRSISLKISLIILDTSRFSKHSCIP